MSFLLRVDSAGTNFQKTATDSGRLVYHDENEKKILAGYAFHGKESEVINCGWENDPAAIQRYDGSMVLISYRGG